MAVAEELGVDHEVILYIKTPPDAAELTKIVKILEDPVEDFVRKDAKFKKLELTDDDVATEDQIVDILVKHKQLLQRPVVVTPDTAIIGRPKDRVRELLGG